MIVRIIWVPLCCHFSIYHEGALSPFQLLNVEQVIFMDKQIKCLRFLLHFICISNADDNFFLFSLLFLFSPT